MSESTQVVVADAVKDVAAGAAEGVKQAEVKEPGKEFYKSKTFWFNVLTAGASYFQYLPSRYALPASFVGNLVLRAVTDQPLSFSSIVGLFKGGK